MPELKTDEILRALDPDLPLLASQAAIELDTLIRKKTTKLSATRRLASLLSKSFEGAQKGPQHHSLVDPATVTLVSRAFLQSHSGGPPVRTVNDLVREASKVAVSLKNTHPDAGQKSLEKARGFCAALAESAASYLQSRYDDFPTHPYRR